MKKLNDHINEIYENQSKSFINELIKILISLDEKWISSNGVNVFELKIDFLENKKRNIKLIVNKDKSGIKLDGYNFDFTQSETKKILKACIIAEKNYILMNKLGKLN